MVSFIDVFLTQLLSISFFFATIALVIWLLWKYKSKIGNWLIEEEEALVKDLIDDLKEIVRDAIRWIIKQITSVFGNVFGFFKGAVNKVGSAGETAVNAVANTGESVINTIGSWF